ncbi:cupin 2 domain-containing protein [Caballeronia calidae]|uniref:Cupin 2 domain-containing protein n=1 Tax=Caballeronia calidae TaxID=1777139 RepID=A0A158E4H7_9BURK|nr:cupin domain-containing protein [Caballeronia calidae]SAL01772.1 cupin 2 domain-containing protein [Caballeronia calidae]
MKMSSFLNVALYVAVFHAAISNAAQTQVSTAPVSATPQIMRAGSQPSVVAPADYFTGRVRIDPVWPANADINAAGNLVTFEPGARTVWHTHPKGQYLMVVSGVGLYQEWGKPTRELHPGDVVWCPPGIKHWHGATPTTAMTHLAVSGTTVGGENVEWMEKVSDAQ